MNKQSINLVRRLLWLFCLTSCNFFSNLAKNWLRTLFTARTNSLLEFKSRPFTDCFSLGDNSGINNQNGLERVGNSVLRRNEYLLSRSINL